MIKRWVYPAGRGMARVATVSNNRVGNVRRFETPNIFFKSKFHQRPIFAPR